jgi:predicted RNase H-like nuclease (RuvC/YqgF family)
MEDGATVEVETDGEEEISLKDMITEIVKEVMATMKSEVHKEEDMKMVEDEEEMKMAKDEEDKMKMAKAEEEAAAAYSAEVEGYKSEISALRSKLEEYENKEKMFLVEKFSMLDSAFIENVKANLASFSIEQLEAKLSVEAVRSGLVFSPKQENVSTYTINDFEKTSAPSWIAALEKL